MKTGNVRVLSCPLSIKGNRCAFVLDRLLMISCDEVIIDVVMIVKDQISMYNVNEQ